MNDSASSHALPSSAETSTCNGECRSNGHHPRVIGTDASATPQPHPGLEALQLVSVSHRSAPIEVLERVALAPDGVRRVLAQLKSAGIEAVAVATCNRTELYWIPGQHPDARTVAVVLTQAWRQPPADFHRYSLELAGEAAARHLFRVAAGLESLVLGESEILGQLRAALETAEAESAAGPLLSELFRSALRFGGRARAQTRIGVGAMSVASAAVHALRRAHHDLSSLTVLVLGAGQTGFKAAQHLRAEGVGRLVVINRTESRAQDVAERLSAEYAPFEQLGARMAEADAVVVAVQAPEPVVTRRTVLDVMNGRHRPLSIIDVSLPRAVAGDVDGIPGVSVVDLSGLEGSVAMSREGRRQEIRRVETILETSFAEFQQQAHEAAARPMVAELRLRAEAIRRAEVERAIAAGLGDRDSLDQVTRRLIDRLLQAPSSALRGRRSSRHHTRAWCLECVFGVGERGSNVDD